MKKTPAQLFLIPTYKDFAALGNYHGRFYFVNVFTLSALRHLTFDPLIEHFEMETAFFFVLMRLI